jgi:hypothetical protein
VAAPHSHEQHIPPKPHGLHTRSQSAHAEDETSITITIVEPRAARRIKGQYVLGLNMSCVVLI